MKIFCISDIHGNETFIHRAAGLIEEAGLVAIGGDISADGSSASAEQIIKAVEKYNSRIIAVHGNWDRPEVRSLLEERDYSLHGRSRIIENIAFMGCGGSTRTPMKTPSEYSEDEIKSVLEKASLEITNPHSVVLLSHTPPKGLKDRTFLGIKAGSIALYEFISQNQVNLLICGHIHEAYGIKTYNNTLIANTGSFKKGRYITAEMGEKIILKQERLK